MILNEQTSLEIRIWNLNTLSALSCNINEIQQYLSVKASGYLNIFTSCLGSGRPCGKQKPSLILNQNFANIIANFANFWRARPRLYRSRILQVKIRVGAFFRLYKIDTLLHRSAFKISAKFRQQFSHFHSCIFKISLISSKTLSKIHESWKFSENY